MPLGVVSITRGVLNRARRGLYAGRLVRSGNNVSEDGHNKTRRTWRPNTQWTKLYSETLDRTFSLRVTTAALRTIDKLGGLDNYLLATPDAALGSDRGAELRSEILLVRQERAAATRAHLPLGLSPAAAAAATDASNGLL